MASSKRYWLSKAASFVPSAGSATARSMTRSPSSKVSNSLPRFNSLAPGKGLSWRFFSWRASDSWRGKNGYVGKILSRPADELVNDLGHFERLLEVAVVNDWGKYKVTITRGPSYPESPADAERLRVDRKATSELAALDIVAKGDHLYVQLRNDTGKIITSAKAELRPLLDDKEGQVIVRINGHINGHTLRLALDRGKAEKD